MQKHLYFLSMQANDHDRSLKLIFYIIKFPLYYKGKIISQRGSSSEVPTLESMQMNRSMAAANQTLLPRCRFHSRKLRRQSTSYIYWSCLIFSPKPRVNHLLTIVLRQNASLSPHSTPQKVTNCTLV